MRRFESCRGRYPKLLVTRGYSLAKGGSTVAVVVPQRPRITGTIGRRVGGDRLSAERLEPSAADHQDPRTGGDDPGCPRRPNRDLLAAAKNRIWPRCRDGRRRRRGQARRRARRVAADGQPVGGRVVVGAAPRRPAAVPVGFPRQQRACAWPCRRRRLSPSASWLTHGGTPRRARHRQTGRPRRATPGREVAGPLRLRRPHVPGARPRGARPSRWARRVVTRSLTRRCRMLRPGWSPHPQPSKGTHPCRW